MAHELEIGIQVNVQQRSGPVLRSHTNYELTCREQVLDAIAIEQDCPLQVCQHILEQR
jgi:hypothetical protein